MSRMGDLMIDIQNDLNEGNLSFAEIAAKHNVPVSWIDETWLEMNESMLELANDPYVTDGFDSYVADNDYFD